MLEESKPLRLKKKFLLGYEVDFLRGGGGVKQFLGQIGEIKLQLKKIVGKMVIEQILMGRSRIHRVKVFLCLDLFVVIRMIQRLRLKIKLL